MSTSLIARGDMSAASITSSAALLDRLDGASLHVAWDGGAAAGTFKLQVADDVGGSYADLAGASWDFSGATGKYIINLSGIDKQGIRCVYTKSSGTGYLDVDLIGGSAESYTKGPIGATYLAFAAGTSVKWPNLKVGASQSSATAVAGELWVDSASGFVIKLGV